MIACRKYESRVAKNVRSDSPIPSLGEEAPFEGFRTQRTHAANCRSRRLVQFWRSNKCVAGDRPAASLHACADSSWFLTSCSPRYMPQSSPYIYRHIGAAFLPREAYLQSRYGKSRLCDIRSSGCRINGYTPFASRLV